MRLDTAGCRHDAPPTGAAAVAAEGSGNSSAARARHPQKGDQPGEAISHSNENPQAPAGFKNYPNWYSNYRTSQPRSQAARIGSCQFVSDCMVGAALAKL